MKYTAFSPGAFAQGSSAHAHVKDDAAVESHGNIATVDTRGSADNPTAGSFAAEG